MASQQNNRRLLVGALLSAFGLFASIGAVYGISGLSGNSPAAGECALATANAETLAPLAIGDVAAFRVEKKPVIAPDFTFRDGEGNERRVADFKGRTILLNLWAIWCAPCRHEMPALDALQANLGSKAFEVVAVSIDLGSPEKPRQFLSEIGAKSLAFYHDPTGKAFFTLRAAGRAIGMPATLIINAEGCVAGHMLGAANWSSNDAVKLILAVQKAQEK
ncbi:thiol:disulfide interchange protein TlpA [Candidatus Raskinella chloraquaticus]|uniref:thiol:disulfide interchange protein TlpA n=1 Tax=Candidatus Raskinella chloraquaticus TaxID=1951219 RepID=UPI0026AA2396